jgi:hypothetical protein
VPPKTVKDDEILGVVPRPSFFYQGTKMAGEEVLTREPIVIDLSDGDAVVVNDAPTGGSTLAATGDSPQGGIEELKRQLGAANAETEKKTKEAAEANDRASREANA